MRTEPEGNNMADKPAAPVGIRALLARDSEYEQRFGTRHRRSGRPSGGDDVIFPSEGVHPVIQRLAMRRAMAVVLDESKERLAALYHSERKVLERRGLKQVAADAGIKVNVSEGDN
jgi:hypothetical protein